MLGFIIPLIIGVFVMLFKLSAKTNNIIKEKRLGGFLQILYWGLIVVAMMFSFAHFINHPQLEKNWFYMLAGVTALAFIVWALDEREEKIAEDYAKLPVGDRKNRKTLNVALVSLLVFFQFFLVIPILYNFIPVISIYFMPYMSEGQMNELVMKGEEMRLEMAQWFDKLPFSISLEVFVTISFIIFLVLLIISIILYIPVIVKSIKEIPRVKIAQFMRTIVIHVAIILNMFTLLWMRKTELYNAIFMDKKLAVMIFSIIILVFLVTSVFRVFGNTVKLISAIIKRNG